MLAEKEVHVQGLVFAGNKAVLTRATHIPTGLVVIARPGEQKRVLLNRLEEKVRAYADELVQQHLAEHGKEILERATGEELTPEEVAAIVNRPN